MAHSAVQATLSPIHDSVHDCIASFDASQCGANLDQAVTGFTAAVAHNSAGAASCAVASPACSTTFDTFNSATASAAAQADTSRTTCAAGESVACSLAIEELTFQADALPTTGTTALAACTSAPAAPIIGTASVTGNSTTATVTFTAPALPGGSAITGYTVTRSGGGTTACAGSPCLVTGLADGNYTFTVMAINAIGTGPASGVSNSVTVDTTTDTSFTSTPVSPSTASVSFAFTSPDATATFECRLDSAAFAPCTSPQALTGLAAGSHTFEVRATDAVGNVDASPASHTWAVGPPPGITNHAGPSPTGTGVITATVTGGGASCGFDVRQFIPVTGHVRSPPAGGAPQGVAFPHGLFDFSLVSCAAGGTVTLTVTYPNPLPAGTRYWKYGPTPTNVAPHWYEMPATVAGSTATFNITDGGLGDDDLLVNGAIIDQGGPGVPGAPGTATAVPTLSEWATIGLGLLMLLLALGPLGRAAGIRRD